MYETLEIQRDGGVATIWMNRPDVHNAFNAQLIADLTAACLALDADDAVRVVTTSSYTLERHLTQFQPDVIQAELLWTAPAALWLRHNIGRPVVLMQENVEYQKFVRFGLTSPFLKVVRWLEGWACRSADRVVALSEVDRDFMIQLYGVPPERFALIPHGVDPELFDHRPEGAAAARQALGVEAGTPLLTFVGKLDYLPNVRAVACIAERIAPAVWQRHPEARFVIVGQGVEAVAEYRRDGLLFTGRAPAPTTLWLHHGQAELRPAANRGRARNDRAPGGPRRATDPPSGGRLRRAPGRPVPALSITSG